MIAKLRKTFKNENQELMISIKSGLTFQEMLKELSQGTDNKNLPLTNSKISATAINQLDQDLATYVTDYGEFSPWNLNHSNPLLIQNLTTSLSLMS